MTDPNKAMEGAIQWAPPDDIDDATRRTPEQADQEVEEQVRSQIATGTEGTHRSIDAIMQTAA
jgi:hypothetical protein